MVCGIDGVFHMKKTKTTRKKKLPDLRNTKRGWRWINKTNFKKEYDQIWKPEHKDSEVCVRLLPILMSHNLTLCGWFF